MTASLSHLRGVWVAVLLGLPMSSAASAGMNQESASANAGVSADLVLTGNIAAKCTVSGGGNIDLGELDADKWVSARFDVGCNIPFQMVFRSTSGGITHAGKPQGEGPYAGTVPYRLGVTVPALSPLPTQLHADFTSAQMVAGGTLDSGDAIAAGGGEIRLQTEMPQGRELLAGEYADSIMIVINPRY